MGLACSSLLAFGAQAQDAPLALRLARALTFPALPVAGTDAAPPVLTLDAAYTLALANDAQLRAQRAATRSREERIPQARAQLFPNVSATSTRFRNQLDSQVPGILGVESSRQRYTSRNDTLVIRQPVFRPFQWADLKQARAHVAEAHAQLDFATQDLAVRVAGAYLDALGAQDQLRLIAARRANYATTLEAARRRFAAGAGTRTDVDEAQARIDLAIAQELEARQALAYTRQQLQAIIGEPPAGLAPLSTDAFVPLPPDPPRSEAWVEMALAASPEVRVMAARVEAARREVEKARAGHLPTLDLVAQWSVNRSDNVTRIDTRYDHKQIGVQLNVPLFAGGYVNSQVRQALSQQRQAEESLDAMRRDLTLRVIKEYRGVSEGVLRVRALEQAVRSAATALDSARKSFQAGARTLVDVLNAQEQLASAEKDLAGARYQYLISRIRLSALAARADDRAMVELTRQASR